MRRHALPFTALLLAALGLIAALLSPPVEAAEASFALLTIVDGEVVVLRDARKFSAGEGLPLQADDIVQTSDRTRLARIELPGGAALDLGPGTRLLLQPRYDDAGTDRPDRPAQVYLAQGWVKLSGVDIGVASARLDVVGVAGATVVHLAADSAFVFVESGGVSLVERGDGRAAARRSLGEGQSYLRLADTAGQVMTRPMPALLAAMPRAFADTLPRRAAGLRGRAVAPLNVDDVDYADVADWIDAERALRPAFVQRWKVKARDPQFRPALVAGLRAHPEWHRVLFPEKYQARRKSAPLPAVASATPRPSNPDRLVEAFASAKESP